MLSSKDIQFLAGFLFFPTLSGELNFFLIKIIMLGWCYHGNTPWRASMSAAQIVYKNQSLELWCKYRGTAPWWPVEQADNALTKRWKRWRSRGVSCSGDQGKGNAVALTSVPKGHHDLSGANQKVIRELMLAVVNYKSNCGRSPV